MEKDVLVAGLRISAFTKAEFLARVDERIKAGQQTITITPYSEFLHQALAHPSSMDLFNRATYSLADGIGILWAQKFLSLPLTSRVRVLRGFRAAWQVVWTLFVLLLNPRLFYTVIPEKIEGSELIFDLADLAARKGYSMYLLGALGNVADRTARALVKRYPDLIIAGARNWDPEEVEKIHADLERVRPAMLLVCYDRSRQERWLIEHVPTFPVHFAIGLGGTFDYIAGDKFSPPRIIRAIGLEWLFRLFTQPKRLRRILNATVGLVYRVWRYKIKHE